MSTIDRTVLLRKNTDLARFRLVEKDDIRPGAELYMAFVGLDERAEYPRPIRMDDEPFGEHQGKPYVYYHCNGYPDLQCFVPVDKFIEKSVSADLCGPHCTTLYLAKTS